MPGVGTAAAATAGVDPNWNMVGADGAGAACVCCWLDDPNTKEDPGIGAAGVILLE